MITFDTETCGYYGPIVLLQWAEDDGEIQLYSPWNERVEDTIELMEYITNHKGGICGFNLSFDWFHICQMYTTLLQFKDKRIYPIDCINDYAINEEKARWHAPCLKPYNPIDIMLHARKGEYQSTMDRSDIKIRRVPTDLAYLLVSELDKRIELKDVYFDRKKDKKKRWQIMDIKNEFGDVNSDFKDVVLKFAPSSALKALAQDALGVDTESIKLFIDVEVPDRLRPNELGYAPFALAIGTPDNWNGAYPSVIHWHVEHWEYNEHARQYATDDVVYTRQLYKYFGSPEPNDSDSVLACMVGTARWRGFSIDKEALIRLKDSAYEYYKKITGLDDTGQYKIFNPNATHSCKYYLYEKLNETEKIFVSGSTKAVILEEIASWTEEQVCDCGGLVDTCIFCDGTGLIDSRTPHPAAVRAKEILDARHMKKEVELYDKLLLAGRLHASFNVIGTLSTRMSGRDGLNTQGIKSSKEVRECFPLADKDMILSGGDFNAFEISLADAAYGDPLLREELLSGKKIHALFGEQVFAPMTYDEIVASKDFSGDKDKYTRSKNGVFALLYGGQAYTLVNRVGISEERAEEAYQKWCTKYKVWAQERAKIFNMFCSMQQPGGIGTKVIWKDPKDYIESMLGFRRYFTLENKITKVLYQLAENPPEEWKTYKNRTTRRDREQTLIGASRSALFAAAFQIQAANMRAAGNHVIQSAGAQLTKYLQVDLWALQPHGIHSWIVQPLNIHDEVMCPVKPEYVKDVNDVVDKFVEKYKKQIPLLSIDWKQHISNWGNK